MAVNLNSTFYQEEVRCDFLVTKERKKIWAVELEILSVFDEICKKHGLKYFAIYGTLLGAVRHQGFVPWDDDLDIAMFRHDYEKLKLIIRDELKEPYFFQDTYTDSILFPFAKIRDSRTAAIEPQYCRDATPNQGIFIDIFPLDGGYPPETGNIEAIQKEIWTSVIDLELITKIINTPEYPTALSRDILQELVMLSTRNRFKQFEAFLSAQFGSAPKIGVILNMLYYANRLEKNWFEDTIYLPFEHTTIPVPAGYDGVLRHYYGNYNRFIRGTSAHSDIIIDPDKSYLEYYKEMGIL